MRVGEFVMGVEDVLVPVKGLRVADGRTRRQRIDRCVSSMNRVVVPRLREVEVAFVILLLAGEVFR